MITFELLGLFVNFAVGYFVQMALARVPQCNTWPKWLSDIVSFSAGTVAEKVIIWVALRF